MSSRPRRRAVGTHAGCSRPSWSPRWGAWVGAWVLWPTEERPVLETSPPGMTFPTVTVVEVFATMADGSGAWVQVPPEYLPEIHPGTG